MIDVKTIGGEQLMSVPILQDAVIHEELMVSSYIALAWSSEEGVELPVGTFIEFEGERYSLYEPYAPTMVNEGEYRYNPRFYSREEAWSKQPACVYTYEADGVTVKSKEFDWSFVGSPADAMQIVKQAIKNEIGEDWTIVIADSLPATIEISSQTSSIASILSDIASQCETEYWVDKENDTLHLSKCEYGEAKVLEVGSNVGVPSVTTKGNEYYTRYYALGSTRNITQSSGTALGSVNKRLTLDPNVFPMGYKDIKGHYENSVFVSDLEKGEIFSKVVLFDDIYPSSDLEIIDVRARMKYRLEGGEKVKIGGTDENPVYDQYAIWYFKIKDFTFSEDSLIEGLPLSVHFKSGRLAGQEFELIYHAKAKRENTDGDVLPFDIEAGDFEIKFKAEGNGYIIPDIGYIIPQNTDKVTLFNIEMPSEYTTAAQQRLLEALDKVIAREHEDSNTYEVESNPIAFYEANVVISLGQKVSFVNGDKSLETRVLMVERRLDSPSEQKIRVGNDLIQGSTKELRANVESLNHNVDVLSAFNDLSKSIQDSYGRTQALINEAVASVLGIWTLDESGNLVTEKQVIIKNDLIVGGDTSSTAKGIDKGTSGTLIGVKVGDKTYAEAYTEYGILNLTEAFNNVSVDLSDYYTKEETASEINTAITALNVGQYATKTALETLQGEVDNIESILGMDEEAEGVINTWNEVKAFLAKIEVGDDLASTLEKMNAEIAKKALSSDLDALAWVVQDKADLAELDKYIKKEATSQTIKGDVIIEGNLVVTGDTASGAKGTDAGVAGTLLGIKVNGKTYDNPVNGILTIPDYPTSLEWSSIDGKPTKLTEFTNDAGFITLAALDDYAKLSDIPTSMAWTAITGKPSFASVATSGKYSDLSGLPTIPTTLPASDVYAWAKAATKPPYTKAEVGLGNVDNLAASGYLTALSSNTTNAVSITVGGTTKNITAATMKTSLGLGSLAYKSSLGKADVGLGNVDNTADADKSVKYATTAGSAKASDVYDWAKASTKPLYKTSEVTEETNLYFTSKRAIDACSGTYLSLANGGTVKGALALSSTLSVASTSTFTGKTTHNGGIGATSGTFSSTLTVSGLLTANSDAVIKGDTSSGSDVRFKDKIEDVMLGIKAIADMPLFTYRWNDREDKTIHLGSSAQYWEKHRSELVYGEDFKSLNYAVLGAAGMKTLAIEVMKLREEVKQLKRRINHGS